MFVLGQPGVGKSALAKRLVMGMAATGAQALILGDTKPDYTMLSATWRPGHPRRPGPGSDQPARRRTARHGAARMSGPDATSSAWRCADAG